MLPVFEPSISVPRNRHPNHMTNLINDLYKFKILSLLLQLHVLFIIPMILFADETAVAHCLL